MAVCNTCLSDMFRISLPPEGSFSGRYTFTRMGVLICKRERDESVCHSQPHGSPPSHAGGRGAGTAQVVTVNHKMQIK